MVFVKNSDEGVFSPHFTAKSIIRAGAHTAHNAHGAGPVDGVFIVATALSIAKASICGARFAF